jgi:ADP-ribosylglycohydrolase
MTTRPTLIGVVAGDIIGSIYEWDGIKTTDFDLFNERCTFTDDTVMTVAVADCILHQQDFTKTIHQYGNQYPGRGYGGRFVDWLMSEQPRPYNSFGNGSAMRASPVGFAYNDLDTVMEMAKKSAEVTHNHPEGIKGAQAVAVAILLARQGASKADIRDYVSTEFGYQLDFTVEEIRPTYKFDVTCQGSVPQAIVAFLDSSDYESAIRLAISLDGDSDTIACIAGGIAAAFYREMPQKIVDFALNKLPEEFIQTLRDFDARYATT